MVLCTYGEKEGSVIKGEPGSSGVLFIVLFFHKHPCFDNLWVCTFKFSVLFMRGIL